MGYFRKMAGTVESRRAIRFCLRCVCRGVRAGPDVLRTGLVCPHRDQQRDMVIKTLEKSIEALKKAA